MEVVDASFTKDSRVSCSASQPPAKKSNHRISSISQKRPMLRVEGRRNKIVDQAKVRQAEEPAVPRDKETPLANGGGSVPLAKRVLDPCRPLSGA